MEGKPHEPTGVAGFSRTVEVWLKTEHLSREERLDRLAARDRRAPRPGVTETAEHDSTRVPARPDLPPLPLRRTDHRARSVNTRFWTVTFSLLVLVLSAPHLTLNPEVLAGRAATCI